MVTKLKYTLGIVILGAFVTAVLFVFSSYNESREAAMRACVLSLEVPILDSFKKDPLPDHPLDSDWQLLSKERSSTLISSLVKSGKTDCGSIRGMQAGVDYWGNTIRIAFHGQLDGSLQIQVWSLGPDGKEKTDDDLYFISSGR